MYEYIPPYHPESTRFAVIVRHVVQHNPEIYVMCEYDKERQVPQFTHSTAKEISKQLYSMIGTKFHYMKGDHWLAQYDDKDTVRMYLIGSEYHDDYQPSHSFTGNLIEFTEEILECEYHMQGSPWWSELHGPIFQYVGDNHATSSTMADIWPQS